MSKPSIGILETGENLNIDLQRLLDTRLLIQSNSGGGKSWCLRRILEQTAGAVQQIILDTEGEFSTLRERFDYIICAPAGADVVATPHTAALLAKHLRESRVSAIIDLYELKMHARRRFVRLFLEEFIDAPKTMWHPAMVVIDEAHLYCPEKGESEAAGAVIDLCSRGRKRGLAALLATQRLSKLHKDAAAECLNKLIGRTGLDVDVKRAAEELGMGARDAVQTLRNLDPGQFFCFGPALSKAVARVTSGEVLTRHPKAGDRGKVTAPEPSEKIRKVLAALEDLPQQAEQEARTVQELRSKIYALNSEMNVLDQRLKAAEKAKPEPVEVRVEVPVIDNRVQDIFSKGYALANELSSLLETIPLPEKPAPAQSKQETPRRASSIPARPQDWTPPPLAAIQLMRDGDKLTGPDKRILDALAWFYVLGILEPEEAAVAFLSGYTVGGGAFNNPKGRLRGHAFIEYRQGGKLAITAAGLARATLPDRTPTNQELHERVLQILPGPHAKLLKILIDNYPAALPDEELAAEANYAIGGAFNNPKGRLRSMGLVTYPQARHVRAADCLFPAGD
jgi:hypothetical protein